MALQSGNSFDEAGDHLQELMHRWDDRLVLKGLSLSKAYLDGRLAIAFVVKESGRSGLGVLAAGQTEVGSSWPTVPSCTQFVCVCYATKSDFGYGSSCDYEPVFVGPIQVIEADKQVSSRILVYKIGDSSRELDGHSLYFDVFRLVYQRIPIVIYRKSGPLGVSVIRDVERAGNMVERGTQIVNSIPDKALDGVFGEDGRTCGDIKFARELSGCRVHTESNVVRIDLPILLAPQFNVTNVLVGPMDL